jgi:hypothetical protein
MSIREGKRTVNKIHAKLDSLDGDIIDVARRRARDYGNRFVFLECDVRHLPELSGSPNQWSHLIVPWQLSLLLAEYTAGMLAQKAAEGHCQTPAHVPCSEMTKGHMKMLSKFKKELQRLVNEICEVEEEVRQETNDLQKPGQVVAWTLGLRDEDPDGGIP